MKSCLTTIAGILVGLVIGLSCVAPEAAPTIPDATQRIAPLIPPVTTTPRAP